ncbi:hypothetical protein [Pseudomonas prosekii]|nr:hypothetical protein [Pseudomonas prosekii]
MQGLLSIGMMPLQVLSLATFIDGICTCRFNAINATKHDQESV